MKSLFRKALALILSSVIVFSAGGAAVFAAADDADNYYKGVFYYRPSIAELKGVPDAFDVYAYSDEAFLQSGKEFSDTLATTSMSLAVASVSSNREPFTTDGYTRKNRNAVAFLEDCGFSDIVLNDDYKRKPTKNSLGVLCAHKTISDGVKSYPLLVILPRSAGYEKEWANNFVLGPSGDAKGFNDCAEKMLAFAKRYAADHQITGSIKVWIAGYSRGAAVANLAGKKLIDAPKEYLGDAIELDSENLFDYTFGTPSAAARENNPRAPKYAGIFNTFSVTEISSSMAPVDMGFERYGTDRIVEDDENYEAMLQYLAVCSPSIYQEYITSAGPMQFHPKKLVITGDDAGIVNDDESYIPSDIAEYLRGFCTYMTQISGGRKTYSEKYEESLSNLLGYYMSLTIDNRDAFNSSLADNEDTLYLVAALYAYFMRCKQTGAVRGNADSAAAVVRELAAVAAPDDAASTGIGAKDIAMVSAKLIWYMTKKPDDLRSIAAGYLASVLPPALEASGADREEILYFSNKDHMDPLAHMLSFLVLGNIWQSDKVAPFDIDNEQIKNAATLIGNFDNYFYDHYNEIVISRLKVEDDRFEIAPITKAKEKGYRRVLLDTDAKINGAVTDGDGNIVGVIRDGVLTDTTDKWVGFTRCDDGDFFRIPLDRDYRITLSVSDAADLKTTVREYDPFDAVAHLVFTESCKVSPADEVILDLPALDEVDQIPSLAEYLLRVNRRVIVGDVDGDGEVTVIDATYIQRKLADLPVDGYVDAAADTDGDGEVTVLDATFIQRYIAGLSAPEGVGKPIG